MSECLWKLEIQQLIVHSINQSIWGPRMVIRITFSNSNIRYFDTILTKLTFLAYLFSYFFNSYFVFTLINQNLCKKEQKISLFKIFIFLGTPQNISGTQTHSLCNFQHNFFHQILLLFSCCSRNSVRIY